MTISDVPPTHNVDVFCGTCHDMCPPSERETRLRNSLVHMLETDRPWTSATESREDNKGMPIALSAAERRRQRRGCATAATANNDIIGANSSRMVKEYARSAADKKISAENVRPYEVLLRTIVYLIDEVLGKRLIEDITESNYDYENQLVSRWPIAYDFVSDRLRAVRQDLTVQQLSVSETRTLLEKMLPFYIIAPFLYSLDGVPSRASSNSRRRMSFDWKLHANELDECFLTWKAAVDECHGGNEMLCAAYLLRRCDDVNAYVRFLKCRSHFSSANLAHSVEAILIAFRLGNFVAFFRQFRALPRLLRCTILSLVPGIRARALHALSNAYGAPNIRIPQMVVMDWLAFANSDDLLECLQETFENHDKTLEKNDDRKVYLKFHGVRHKLVKSQPYDGLRHAFQHFDAHWLRTDASKRGTLQEILQCILAEPRYFDPIT